MPTLREQIVHDLSRRKLDRLSRDLGIFDAPGLTEEKLHTRFQRSRQFSNDTLLHFMVLADIRAVAKSLGIETTKVPRRVLISDLLDYRASPQKESKTKAEAKAKVKPKVKPKAKSKNASEKKDTQSSETQQDVDSIETEPTESKEQVHLIDHEPVSVHVDLQQVPPSLVACKHLWLHKAGPHWVLSSKGGYTISVFESEPEAQLWHREFDKIRRYEHVPAIKSLPRGCKKIQPGGPVYPPGWSPKEIISGEETEEDTEDSAEIAEQVDIPDTPDTLYECPVCEDSIQLRNARTHLFGHSKRGEIKSQLSDLVYGLEYVADGVMANQRKRAPDSAPNRSKRKVGLVRTKPKGAAKKSVRSKKKVKKAKESSSYGGASQDLWDRNRPWSGGGANGTGSRR